MKRIATLAAALTLTVVGCGSQPTSSTSATSTTSVTSATDTSSSVQSVSTVKFADVKTAAEAAKGAGFDKFGIFDKLTLDDKEFKSPKFAYAEGVAQATYENGAVALVIRKADGKHTAPLTDRDKTEFASKWTKSYEGLDVTCYGAAKGAATVITWTDGTQEFGVTYQGFAARRSPSTPTRSRPS